MVQNIHYHPRGEKRDHAEGDSRLENTRPKTSWASPSQLHTMASLDHHAGTPLMSVWPQLLSLAAAGDSTTLSCILDSKAKTMWLKLPSSTAWWAGTLPLPSITSAPAFCCWWSPSLLKLAFDSFRVGSLAGWGSRPEVTTPFIPTSIMLFFKHF